MSTFFSNLFTQSNTDEGKVVYDKEQLQAIANLKKQIIEQHNDSAISFDPKNQTQMGLVVSLTDSVQQNLSKLQAIDKKIATGFVIGTAGLTFSFLPFNWFITLAGFTYGAYHLGMREHAYMEYNKSLEDLVSCCHWALANTNLTANNLETPRYAGITEMLETLAPLITETQLQDVFNDDLTRATRVVNTLKKYHEQRVDSQTATHETTSSDFATRTDNLNYKLYGYKQNGSLSELAQIAGGYIKEAFIQTKDLLVNTMMTSTDAPSAPKYHR